MILGCKLDILLDFSYVLKWFLVKFYLLIIREKKFFKNFQKLACYGYFSAKISKNAIFSWFFAYFGLKIGLKIGL